MIRYLLLSLFILIGCSPARPILKSAQLTPECVQKFIPDFKSDWYNCSVDVVGKHISGLLLIKKLDDQSLRLVFTNEAGVKFFDFGFDADGNFKSYQVMSKLNKKVVIKTFQKDFELMLMLKAKNKTLSSFSVDNESLFVIDSGSEADYFVTNSDCTNLIRLEKWGRKKKMTEITFSSTSGVPENIEIKHFNFDMTIKMKKLER